MPFISIPTPGTSGGGGGDGTVLQLPHRLDNTSKGFAKLEIQGSQFADLWAGSNRISFFDGVNTHVILFKNDAGSAAKADEYDAGGGAGYNAGLLARCLELAFIAGSSTIRPHWEQLTYDYLTASFAIGLDFGQALYLENTTGRHDLITATAVNGDGLGGTGVWTDAATLITLTPGDNKA